jgi:hypothetical protein
MPLSRSQTPFLVATNVLTSWLEHLKIPHRLTSDSTVVVGEVSFRLFDSQAANKPEWSSHPIDVRALASSNPDISLRALHKITETAGFGTPNPMRSRIRAKRQQHAGLSALRLAEYAQAPDLSPRTLALYMPTIAATINGFCGSWHNNMNLRRACLSHEDLINAGVIWATNFHHRYRRSGDDLDTRRLLRHYIQQRLVHLLALQSNKTKHVTSTVSLDHQTSEAIDKEVMEKRDVDSVDSKQNHLEDLQERLSYMPAPEFQIRLQRAVEQNPELKWLATRYSKSLQRKLTNTIVE